MSLTISRIILLSVKILKGFRLNHTLVSLHQIFISEHSERSILKTLYTYICSNYFITIFRYARVIKMSVHSVHLKKTNVPIRWWNSKLNSNKHTFHRTKKNIQHITTHLLIWWNHHIHKKPYARSTPLFMPCWYKFLVFWEPMRWLPQIFALWELTSTALEKVTVR